MKSIQLTMKTLGPIATVFFCATSTWGSSRPSSGAYGAILTPALPAKAVVVPASQGALAAAINAHGSNTTFFLQTGVHIGNGMMRPKAGAVFVGAKGAILDGENTTPHCFKHDPGVIPYSASAPRYVVTLRNLTIRNYVPPDQDCAVMAEGLSLIHI